MLNLSPLYPLFYKVKCRFGYPDQKIYHLHCLPCGVSSTSMTTVDRKVSKKVPRDQRLPVVNQNASISIPREAFVGENFQSLLIP